MIARILGASMAAVALCAAEPWQTPQPARATIAQVAWIAGTWSGGQGPMTVEERWTPPAGGAMLAVARTLRENRMVAFEYLRIVEREGRAGLHRTAERPSSHGIPVDGD